MDTDVFIDHLRGNTRIPRDRALAYSVVTRCELFSGKRDDESRLRRLMDPLDEILVDRTIAEYAGRLRRSLDRLLTPDALIAATALVHGLPLMTRNLRDFEPVPGLEVRSPG